MKGGTQAAVAIGVGYVLGRRRKMRTATLLVAATAAGGGMGGIGGAVLRRGTKALGSTDLLGKVAPQLSEITDAVRGDLLNAGKAAAVAAVNGRIESLTDSLHDRAQALRDPGAAVGEAGDTARRTADDTVRRATGGSRRGRRAADEPDDDDRARPEDEDELEQADADDADAGDAEADDVEADDAEADEEPDEQPRRRPARRSAPVARARR
jgi:hypothetical protein